MFTLVFFYSIAAFTLSYTSTYKKSYLIIIANDPITMKCRSSKGFRLLVYDNSQHVFDYILYIIYTLMRWVIKFIYHEIFGIKKRLLEQCLSTLRQILKRDLIRWFVVEVYTRNKSFQIKSALLKCPCGEENRFLLMVNGITDSKNLNDQVLKSKKRKP